MLGREAAHGPVVLHARVPLPQAARLALLVQRPRGIEASRDVLGGGPAAEDLRRDGARVLVREAGAPHHGVGVQDRAVAESHARLGEGDGLDGCLDAGLAFGEEVRGTDVHVVATGTLQEVLG